MISIIENALTATSLRPIRCLLKIRVDETTIAESVVATTCEAKNHCRIEYKVGVMELNVEIVVFNPGVQTR